MIRKLKISIRTKLIIFVSLLLISNLTIFVFYAIDAFRGDKKTYISSEVFNSNSTLKTNIEDFITSQLKDAYLVAATQGVNNKYQQPLDQGIFQSNPNFAQIKVVASDDMQRVLNFTNSKMLNQSQIEQLNNRDDSTDIGRAIDSKKIIVSKSLDNIFSLYHFIEQSQQVIIARISSQSLKKVLDQNKAYQIDLLHYNGDAIVSNVARSVPLSSEPYIKDIIKQKFPANVTQIVDSIGEKYLMGYSKIPQFDLIITSRISEAKAYELIQEFLIKSLTLGAGLLIVGLILTFLLASSLTNPIRTLMLGTQELAKRNFGVEVDIPSNDEIGVLADSFNYMANEILSYVDAIQDKARMENELAVAQLVQSSFFPPENLKTGHLDVRGFYQSASECGGDWWGYYDSDDRLIIYIGDATGHGVPAALITATAHCSMKILQKFAPALIGRPDGILKLMNHAIYQAGGNIFMTFFLGVIDKKTNTLYYSNASHNPPFIYRHSEDEPSKENIDVLMDAVSSRLGHKQDAKFALAKTQLNPGDCILLYTDGILEGENPDKKQWGERRFLKSFLRNVHNSPDHIIQGLLKDSAEFYQGVEVDDDITLLVTKINQ